MAPHILQLQGSIHSSPLKSAALSIPVSLNSAFVQGSESGLWSDPDFIANLNLLSSFLIVCTNEPVLSFIIQDYLNMLLTTVFQLGGKKKSNKFDFPKG